MINENETALSSGFTMFARVQSLGRPKAGGAWDVAAAEYEDTNKQLATFRTIEQFWGMYQHLQRPSKIPAGTQFNLFVEGIKPIWEVDEHKTGGVWNLRINKGYANLLWENLILGFIGDQFTYRNEVTGIILNLTANNDRLSVWIRHGTNQTRVKEIKKDLIRIMGLP